MKVRTRIGLIADTHGLLRPAVKAFLSGCDRIIHAGDVCAPGILEELAMLAPVTAVLGNNDKGDWTQRYRKSEMIRIGDVYLYVIHDLAELDIEPAASGVTVVVSGHSHHPSMEWLEGVLYVNPGSAGPRRFNLPIAAAELIVEGPQVSAKIEVFPAS